MVADCTSLSPVSRSRPSGTWSSSAGEAIPLLSVPSNVPKTTKKLSLHLVERSRDPSDGRGAEAVPSHHDTGDKEVQSATISAPFRRVRRTMPLTLLATRLGKRALPNQRINRTVTCVDDSNAPQHRQRPHYAGDTMKVSNTTCSGYNPLLS